MPSTWQFREKKSEYGIDGEIEIFSVEGYTTGLLCHVQLKSTDDVSSKAQRIRIKTSTYNYWRQLAQPVLVVRWLEQAKQLFVAWNYTIDPTPKQLAAETFRFEFSDADKWVATTATRLAIDLRHIQQASAPLSRPLNVAFRFESLTPEQQAYMHAALDQVRTISDSGKLPFAFRDVAAIDAIVVIEVRPTEVRISVARKPGVVLDLRHSDWQANSASELAVQILCMLAIALANSRQDQLAVEVISSLLNEFSSLDNSRTQILLAQILARNERLDTLFEFSSRIKDPHPAFVMAVMAMPLDKTSNASDAMLDKLVDLHRATAANAPDHEKATLHYRIFGFQHHRGRYKEAVEELEQAAVADSTYRQRDYFHQELGACYFELHQYDKALDAYREAERLGYRKNIQALQADCLFHGGRYRQAAELWEAFLESDTRPKQRFMWVLPLYAARYLWLNLAIPSQTRGKGDYGNQVPPFDPQASLEEAMSVCRSMLQSDALDPFIWFNLGVCAQRTKNFQFVEFAFMIAGLLNRKDAESWKNAALAALSAKSPYERLAAIFYNGMHYCGEEFRTAVISSLRECHPSLATQVDTLIYDLYESSREEEKLIRIIAPGGNRYRTVRLDRRGDLIRESK